MAEGDPKQNMAAARTAATARITTSRHPLRVVIAGPGTGKTTAFTEALRDVGGGGLALTFLRVLAHDLAKSLDGLATSSTFHSYAKALVHGLSPVGLTAGFPLYPPLLELESEDLTLLGEGAPTQGDLKQALQDLDAGSLPARVLDLGSYYNAAGFEDAVYRVYVHLDANRGEIPILPLVVVDEYQDFSLLETRFIDLLATKSRILIAGDDDQALYAFRHASVDYVRALAARPDVEVHNLPYCSRCTEVVVQAVLRVVERAEAVGSLSGRIPKPFECYMPTKGADSTDHPKILDVQCSTAAVMAMYVADEIARIPAEDVQASVDGGYPTVLVIGRKQFTKPLFNELKKVYPQTVMAPTGNPPIEPAEGYALLARDERSNLGWRILVRVNPYKGWQAAVRKSLAEGQPLVDNLPASYKAKHLQTVMICRHLLNEEEATESEMTSLVTALRVPADQVRQALRLIDHQSEEGTEAPASDTERPQLTIRMTSMNGAKGLSAEHVFVIGCVDGHFPEDPRHPSDQEISQFLVALSRTRKACHLLSCKVFYPQTTLRPSLFVRWLSGLTEQRTISAATFKTK